MKAWMAIAATLPFFTGCMVAVDAPGTTGNGDGILVSETRDLPAFQGVEVHGNVNVTIRDGSSYQAVVTMDDNLTSTLTTDTRGGVLVIDGSQAWQASVTPSVVVTLPSLSGVYQYGSGNIVVDMSAWQDQVTLENDGSGSIQFTGAASHIVATTQASGPIDLIGYADVLDATSESSGNILADGMLTADVQAQNSGASDITLDLDTGAWLTATIYGSGNVEWWGLPAKLTYDLEGSGKVIEHRMLAKVAAQGSTALKFKALKPAAK